MEVNDVHLAPYRQCARKLNGRARLGRNRALNAASVMLSLGHPTIGWMFDERRLRRDTGPARTARWSPSRSRPARPSLDDVMTLDDGGLRRADWRFLLPAPAAGRFRHMVVLGGPAGLSSRIEEAGTATRVTTALADDEKPDALIILADATVSIANAARTLAADGVLYWEIERRPRFGGMKRRGWIRRRLRQAGLLEWATYWVVPSFQEARRYLPLHVGAAVEWFLDTRYVASTPTRLCLEYVLRVAERAGRDVLVSVLPSLAVIARGSAHAGGPAWALAGPALPTPVGQPGVSPALFTSGQDDGSRVVVLPFATGDSRPSVVLKSARLAGFTGHTQREQETLLRLRAKLPPDLRATLPEPKGNVGADPNPVFLESAVPGRMVAATTGRWRAPLTAQLEDLELATDWLIRFHLATESRRVRWSPAESERWLEPVLQRYDRAFGSDEHAARLFPRLRDHARTMTDAHLPIVCCHNDYNPWHLYRSGRDVSVIDWEFGEQDIATRYGPALCDLLYFTVHWVNLARGLHSSAAQVRGFTELFIGSAPLREPWYEGARRAVTRYMGRLEMARGFLPLLLAYTWIDRAADWHHRQSQAGASQTVARELNPFMGYVRVLVENADRQDDAIEGPWSPGSDRASGRR